MVLMVIGALGLWILYRFIRVTHWLGRLQRTVAALRTRPHVQQESARGMSISFGIHCLSFLIGFLFARGLGIGITYLPNPPHNALLCCCW